MTLSQDYLYIQYKYQGMIIDRKLKVPKQIEILKILINKGSTGVAACELPDELAVRLAGYVYQFRNDWRLEITNKRKRRDSALCGRYILITDVKIF